MINLFGALAKPASAGSEAENSPVSISLFGENETGFADCIACLAADSTLDATDQEKSEIQDELMHSSPQKKLETTHDYSILWQMFGKVGETPQSQPLAIGESKTTTFDVTSDKSSVQWTPTTTQNSYSQSRTHEPSESTLAAASIDKRNTSTALSIGSENVKIDGRNPKTEKPEPIVRESADFVGLRFGRINQPSASTDSVTKSKNEFMDVPNVADVTGAINSALASVVETVQDVLQSQTDTSGLHPESLMTPPTSVSNQLIRSDRHEARHTLPALGQKPDETMGQSFSIDVSPVLGSEANQTNYDRRSRPEEPIATAEQTRVTENVVRVNRYEDSSSSQSSVSDLKKETGFEQVMESERERDITPIAESVIGQLVNGLAVNEIQNFSRTDDLKQEMTIQIHPQELGKLEIKVEMGDNGLAAEIIASEALTSDLLNREREALVEALREKGIELPNFNISHQQTRQENSSSGQNNSELQSFFPKKRASLNAIKTPEPSSASASQINVIA